MMGGHCRCPLQHIPVCDVSSVDTRVHLSHLPAVLSPGDGHLPGRHQRRQLALDMRALGAAEPVALRQL